MRHLVSYRDWVVGAPPVLEFVMSLAGISKPHPSWTTGSHLDDDQI